MPNKQMAGLLILMTNVRNRREKEERLFPCYIKLERKEENKKHAIDHVSTLAIFGLGDRSSREGWGGLI